MRNGMFSVFPTAVSCEQGTRVISESAQQCHKMVQESNLHRPASPRLIRDTRAQAQGLLSAVWSANLRVGEAGDVLVLQQPLAIRQLDMRQRHLQCARQPASDSYNTTKGADNG